MANIYPQGSSLTKFTSNQDNSQLSTHLNLAICQVCYGKQSDACKKPEFNVQIHICKTCNLSVHKACYGVPSNVENTFFCDRCVEVGPNTNLTCEICHQMNGALKKAGEFWVHVTCALFTKLTHTVD